MISESNYEFRISKYDPAYRVNGAYTRNEWTSIHDIGRSFDGVVFTDNEYYNAEHRYLSFIRELLLILDAPKLQLEGLEDPYSRCPYPDKSVLCAADDILSVAQGCLREQYWCRLESSELSFHFGYDYYLYVKSPIQADQMIKLASEFHLFPENIPSPYRNTD